LPNTPTFDAGARVERVDDTPPEEVVRDRWRGNEEVSCDRRCANLGVVRSRLAEEKSESWPGGAKPSRRRHREVELKRVRQQEHAIRGRAALEVSKLHRVPLADEHARPVGEHLSGRQTVSDAKGEVQVGEAVAAVHGERAHGRSSDDALVLLREPQHLLAESIPLLNGEHGARF
jgi:hypothetical protein